jgi:nucleoside-diphosphate-sugar epimerase
VNVVVAGGTGFVGRAITRRLLDDEHSVAVLGRDPGKVASMGELLGARAIKGDVTEPAALIGTLEGADVVVNAAQFPNHPVEVPRKGLTYDRYDRRGTENLIAEAKRAGVERFI